MRVLCTIWYYIYKRHKQTTLFSLSRFSTRKTMNVIYCVYCMLLLRHSFLLSLFGLEQLNTYVIVDILWLMTIPIFLNYSKNNCFACSSFFPWFFLSIFSTFEVSFFRFFFFVHLRNGVSWCWKMSTEPNAFLSCVHISYIRLRISHIFSIVLQFFSSFVCSSDLKSR